MSMLDQAAARRVIERLGTVPLQVQLDRLFPEAQWLDAFHREVGIRGVFKPDQLRRIADIMDGSTINR